QPGERIEQTTAGRRHALAAEALAADTGTALAERVDQVRPMQVAARFAGTEEDRRRLPGRPGRRQRTRKRLFCLPHDGLLAVRERRDEMAGKGSRKPRTVATASCAGLASGGCEPPGSRPDCGRGPGADPLARVP